VGDELLAAAAPRLKQAVRSTDTVARFGGDEFGILLEDITSERDAIETAERIAAIFARPFVLSGSEHFVTASIGTTLATGSEQADELIRDADAAMYRAKGRGRGAAALAPPRAGRDTSLGVHPHRRGERADRADRPLGARARLPAGGAVVSGPAGHRPAHDVGEPVRRPGHPALAARHRPFGPAQHGPRPRLPQSRDQITRILERGPDWLTELENERAA
jgi:hypothetical protein